MQSINAIVGGFQNLAQTFAQLSQASLSPVTQPAVNSTSSSSGTQGTTSSFSSLLSQLQSQFSSVLPDALNASSSTGATSTTQSATATSTGAASTSALLSQLSQLGGSGSVGAGVSALLGALTPTTGTASASASVSSGSSQASFGSSVVVDSLRYLGVPYVYGGTSPTTGMDCSGLVQRVFADLGVALPRTAAQQSQVGTNVPSLSQALPGDLVFYGSPAEHVGIYLGNGQIINAPHSGQTVSITGVGNPTDIQRIAAPAFDQSSLGLNPSVSPTESQVASEVGVPAALEPIFAAATQRFNLPPGLLEAVGKVESNFNVNAVSSAGAQGLMQIMPQTAAGIGINPNDPVQAINGAAQLLAEKLQTFGSVPLAVAAYNAGDGAVQQYQGIPPYAQTQNYVQSVMSYLGGA